MKLPLYQIIILLFFSTVFSQNNYSFLGVITLPDNSILSYRLYFTETGQKIEGYSVTDLQGDHETKSAIKGNIDIKNKKIEFKEYDILYTKSTEPSSDFCFVNFNGKIKISKSKRFIEGDFIGLYDDNVTCVDGKIKLIGENNFLKKVNKISKKTKRIKRIPDSIKESLEPIKMINNLKLNTLKSNENIYVYTSSEEYILKLWDAGKEDEDRIHVYLNDKILLKDYEVIKTTKVLKIKLNPGENIIKVVARNNGKIPPNTAMIEITDGKVKHNLSTNLSKDQSAKLTIVKK